MTDKQYKTSRMQIESMRVWIKDLTIIDGVSLLGVVAVGIYLGTLLHPFINGEKYVSFAEFLGGFLGVVGILLLSKRTFNQDKQIQFQIDKEVDDRFTSAVTLLGSNQTSARTGSLYVLYDLAIKNDKYRKQAAEIMCAHIRGHTQMPKYKEENKEKPADEIQTAINLLFRGSETQDQKGLYCHSFAASLHRPNLSYSFLKGANFHRAICICADFRFADCTGAIFTKSKCQGASFHLATCYASNFDEADCQGAHFRRAKCQGANFRRAQCQGAYFMGAQCQGAHFWRTECQGANFRRAQCQGAHFIMTKCQAANFTMALCQGAHFTGAQCQGANFKKTECQGAIASEENYGHELSARVGMDTVLENLVFSGGLAENFLTELKPLAELHRGLWFERMKKLHEEHRDKNPDNTLPEGIITGVLEDTAKIQKIIAEITKIRSSNI